MSTPEPTAALTAAMVDVGLTPPTIKWTGKIERFRDPPDKKNDNGWYIAYPDAPQNAVFGSWRTQVRGKWTSKAPVDNGVDISMTREAWAAKERKREEEREREWEKGAAKCKRQYDGAGVPSLDHPYLVKKGIDSALDLRQVGDVLIVPMKSTETGKLTSLQYIEPDGTKRFAKGTRAHGARTTIGIEAFKKAQIVYVTEGWATGWTIHHVTGEAVVVAFFAGNILPVAEGLRKKYPKARIIITADNDRWTSTGDVHNPGVTAAQKAAEAAAALLAIPDFEELKGHPTDFNDLWALEGDEAVLHWLDPGNAVGAVTVLEGEDGAEPTEPGREAESSPERPEAVDGAPEIEKERGDPAGLEPHEGMGRGEASPTLTDAGNASRFAGLHGERLHYIAPWRKWLTFVAERGAWILDYADVHVRELAKDVGHALKAAAAREPDEDVAKRLFAFAFRSLNARGISGMVDLSRGMDGIPLDHEDLDRNGWLLGVRNGAMDLRTGRLRAADPADLMTMQCPVSWDPNATAPRWEQAMVEWFPDPEVRGYVKRVAGSALVGAQRDHVLVIFYGGGRNGKGTFVRALQHVLGPYAVVIHLSLLVEQKYSQHDTIKAELFRARLAVASETGRRIRLDEASVKNLTGGDRITARRMREDPWEFDPTHSLWLQTNHLPEISGRDAGIWGRVRVVKWEATFEGKTQDTTLDDKLAAEAAGILSWLVAGCLEWQEHGLAEPEAVIRATLSYRQAEDTFSRFVAQTGLIFRRDLEMQAAELQRLLSDWAEAEGVDPPRQELGNWLRENAVYQKRKKWTDSDGKGRQARFWLGIGIDDKQHETEQVDALA